LSNALFFTFGNQQTNSRIGKQFQIFLASTMKALFCCTSLLFLGLFSGNPIAAQPTPTPTPTAPANTSGTTNADAFVGTWLVEEGNQRFLIILNRTGEMNVAREQVYGDYRYYQQIIADYSFLMSRLNRNSLEPDPLPKYRIQGNLIKVNVNGTDSEMRFEFAADRQSIQFFNGTATTPNSTFKRFSDRTELPVDTESTATVESHFFGLKKLVAIQVAETKYWQKRRRFTQQLSSLTLPQLAQSDERYSYQITQANRKQSIITAIPKQPNLRSYVLQIDHKGLRNQPFNTLLCGTDRPSNQLPALPKVVNKKLTCPAQTHAIEIQ
jgi:Type IV pilin-like G and H, putative